MFVNAYEIARSFTNPIFVSQRTATGNVRTSIGAFVTIEDGWAITAGHILSMAVRAQTDAPKVQEYKDELAAIEKSGAAPGKKKSKVRKLRKRLQPNELIENTAVFAGHPDIELGTVHIHADADLAVFAVNNMPDAFVTEYPRLQRPEDMKMGRSVLKFGYPFHTSGATFNATTNTFEFEPGTFPVPIFPLEGMTTRFRDGGTNPAAGYNIRMLEISTPGLRGQSGGPIVDTEGVVWGLQIQTQSLELGFTPTFTKGGKKYTEHQFLNVGTAVDSGTIGSILEIHGLTPNWA